VKHARIMWQGAVHSAVAVGSDADPHTLRLADGRMLAAAQVTQWLAPVPPALDAQGMPRARTILALGLNYADHAKELAFKAPEEPLAFLKAPSALTGHASTTARPADVTHMHYECELVVVIGRPTHRVARAQALAHVAGYSIANDYALRDYLENWYRPNLRVKNRPATTPLGPWLVDAADIGDPGALALSTHVNGMLTQRGHTRDLIFDVPTLIEHFSAYMALLPGDLILTGTPDGVKDCPVGSVVDCRIDGLGTLTNTVVAAPT
jgi:5-oxopent-3-ene-1,2,5-tricarboxylate decarboxylase / 2-hydroxyhepta-2,4-diene-1,7-dioate isomerase